MGAEINSTAMQEVGIMRLFHWLKFNWEAAVGWRRQERLLKSSSVPPFFIRELLSFLRPLPVPCPLATSLPIPPSRPPPRYRQWCAHSKISTDCILSCISGFGMINQPTSQTLRLLESRRAHTNRYFLTHAHRVLGENLLSNFICLVLLPFIVVSSSLHIHLSSRRVPLLPFRVALGQHFVILIWKHLSGSGFSGGSFGRLGYMRLLTVSEWLWQAAHLLCPSSVCGGCLLSVVFDAEAPSDQDALSI